MEQIKRSVSDTILNYTTAESNWILEESISIFEHLSNELLYEIFEFLDFHHAFYAFYNLNERFQNLFIHSNLPIKINISSISKSAFQRYLTHIIIPQTHQIKSFRLSNPFAADMILSIVPVITNFIQLKILIINNIEANYIEQIVNHLFTLPVLSSLTITSTDHIQNQNDTYEKIFRLPRLKYCQLLIETKQYLLPLSIATKEFSPIEHLVINNKVSLNQINSLLSYIPEVRRLSFGHLNGSRGSRVHNKSIVLNYLEDVSLKLDSVSFNDFELLVTDCFRHVQILRVVTCSHRFHYYDSLEYLNADRWERLISAHMMNLDIFDFQHRYRLFRYNDDRGTYETKVKKFNSLFWTKRQWFFEYQYQDATGHKFAIFYSINPYRKKCYMLYENSTKNIWPQHLKSTVHSIRHVDIHNTNAMKQFVDDFPNATQLTLSEDFDVPRNSLVTDLSRIIPLKQLTQLTLNCHRFHFEQIVEFLHSTPNIRTLELDSILLYGMDSLSIEQTDIFQIVSITNIITNLTINNECTLDKIELLVALFPRIEYLTINLYKEDLESITRFLLSKFNDNTQHLTSLCILKQRKILIEQMKSLLESEKLLDNYTLKSINRKLYLWW